MQAFGEYIKVYIGELGRRCPELKKGIDITMAIKQKTLDMTVGSPVRHIILFSIPALIGNIFQQVYNLVDSIIVGKFVGAEALAAVGVTGPINFFFFAICNGIGTGGGIVASQYFGAHDDENVKKCIVNTGIIMLVFPLIIGALGMTLSGSLLRALGTPSDIIAEAARYARLMSGGLIFVSVYNFISAMLRALGDSKTPLYFLILSSLVNVVLDILFVYTFNMGVFGAGLATVIAQITAAASCAAFARKTNPYFRVDRSDISIDGGMVWKVVRLGIPMSLQFSLIAISSMAVQRVVNSFETVAVAAYTATSRIEQLVHSPYQTLSASLATFCGQNYGAKNHKRVLSGYRKCLAMMGALTVVLVLVMQFFSAGITSLFVSEKDVIKLGARGLRVTSYFYITLGLIYIVRGILNGVGDAFFAMFNGVVEVIGRFLVPVLLINVFEMDVMGIWWSCGIVWAISGSTAWLRYLKYYRFAKKEMKKLPA